jgi:hypothetical protein
LVSFLATQIVNKKRADINDSSKMLNKLLSRKKIPAKKRKKATTTTCDGNYTDAIKISNKLYL